MRRAPELVIAALLIAAATAAYVLAVPRGAAASDSAVGLALGITGFTLMLLTEVLYSIRKRARDRAWGRMSTWLRAHIVTGLVGPYLVLLHSTGHLHGTGGWAALATVVVVLSGFTGRYLYTAIPRAPGGAELSAAEIEAELSNAEMRLSSPDLGKRARRRLTAQTLRLKRRARTASATRRLLARWHTVHVPLSLALFTLIGIHIAVALYYMAGMH